MQYVTTYLHNVYNAGAVCNTHYYYANLSPWSLTTPRITDYPCHSIRMSKSRTIDNPLNFSVPNCATTGSNARPTGPTYIRDDRDPRRAARGLRGNLQSCRRAGIFRINALITDDISARWDAVRANLDVPTWGSSKGRKRIYRPWWTGWHAVVVVVSAAVATDATAAAAAAIADINVSHGDLAR